MESCTACFCPQLNGQWTNSQCPQQDCFKYCMLVHDNSGEAYDIRTLTTNECAQVYAGDNLKIQRCQSEAIISGSAADPNTGGETLPEQAQKSNRNIILISVLLVVLIIVSVLIYSL